MGFIKLRPSVAGRREHSPGYEDGLCSHTVAPSRILRLKKKINNKKNVNLSFHSFIGKLALLFLSLYCAQHLKIFLSEKRRRSCSSFTEVSRFHIFLLGLH